jgi:uncharacterized protein DUF6113
MRSLTTWAYVALFGFGAGQGVLGAFFYNAGPPPLASLAFDLLILVTCLLGAWGTGHAVGGFVPAVGWFIAAFVLASGTHQGSVIIAATSGGEWFLFGGAISAMIGVIGGFTLWSSRRPAGPLPRDRDGFTSHGPVKPPRS